MTRLPPDRRKWPSYYSGPDEHLHALGVISVQYNMLEQRIHNLFAHHLLLTGVSDDECQFLFGQQTNAERMDTITLLFAKREKDNKVREHIKHFAAYFSACQEKRHLLMHSWLHTSQEELWDDLDGYQADKLSLQKRSKDDPSRLNFMHLSIHALRAVADEMQAGANYAIRLFGYLDIRDNSHNWPRDKPILRDYGWMYFSSKGWTFPSPSRQPSLPGKPRMPRKLKLRRHPVVPPTATTLPEPSGR